MADGDETVPVADTSDHSPDMEGEIGQSHGFDAIFFFLMALIALALVVGIFYFKG